ncbi:MAG: hypothetical protein LBQ77_07060 [Treponema sp.]|nr:hypothetical protein [Treponema sp.]
MCTGATLERNAYGYGSAGLTKEPVVTTIEIPLQSRKEVGVLWSDPQT